MLSDPRSIVYVAECLQPQMRHDPQVLQKLYTKLMGEPSLSYTNFNLVPGGAHLTTVHGPASVSGASSFSLLALMPDRIQIKEQWPMLSLDDFILKARRALELSCQELAIPAFQGIQIAIQCLVNMKGVDDSRQFLNEQFFRMDQHAVDNLGRQPALFGLRFVFPASENDQSVHNVRIESFDRDPRSFFLEECGVYSGPLTTQDFSPVERAIRSSYDFVTENVTEYLQSFGPSL